MESLIKKLSILTIIIAAVAFGLFLSSSLNIMNFSNGDTREGDAAGSLYMEGDGSGRPVSFPDLAKMANPTVVNITSTTTSVRSSDRPDDLFEFFFGRDSMEPRRPVRGFGSGFIISKDGYILTNYHVVSNQQRKVADDIKVKLYNENIYKAKVIGTDSVFDVALLKIDADEELPFIKLGDSDKIKVGEWVMAIGNPSLLEHTVTVGVLSAKGRQISGSIYRTFLQTDAAINHGNSGGPLINMKGEAIGINAMIIYGTEGIGFAIPINQIKNILPQLKEKGYVQRGYIGILPGEITKDLAKSLNLPTTEGIFVQSVTPNNPADKAGIKEGDIIISFDGKEIKNLEDLYSVVALSKPGVKTTVKVIRDEEKKTLEITPEERPGEDVPVRDEPERDEQLDETLGMAVAPISPRVRRYFRIPSNLDGVIITKVKAYSPAYDAGLREEMIIQKVNRKDINGIKEFYIELDRAIEKSNVVALKVAVRDRRGNWLSQYVTLNLAQ